MLEQLRGAAAGIVAKGLMGLLVLSFAVWGVQDVFFGYGTNTLATVGDTEIGAGSFNNAYQRELAAMADRLGRRLTPDEARAFGIDRRVLSEQLTAATLTNQARTLGLNVSDEYLAEKIVSDPVFADAFGRFSRDRFERIIAASGYSEETYVAERQRAEMQGQLTTTVAGGLKAPDALLAAFQDFQGARRLVEYFTVPAEDPADVPTPEESALRDFYDAHKARFTAPELRKLTVVGLEPADLTDTVAVAEEDIAARYEGRRHAYETPERREIDQLMLADAKQAAEAHQKMVGGRDFLDVAAEYGFSADDVDLGNVTQSEIVDPKLAKAAFALAEGEVSQPVEGSLGTAILRARAVTPAQSRSLADVHEEIRKELALERAADEVLDLRDAVEDERAAGLSLKEVAGKLDLKLIEVDAVDRQGNGPGGDPDPALPRNPAILRTAFESDVGLENDPVETTSGGFFWVEVAEITPETLKPFDAVRGEIEEVWRADQVDQALREKADELAAKARGAGDLSATAASIGAEVVTSEPFTRRAPNAPFSTSFVQAVFAAPAGQVLTGRPQEGDGMVVARIKELIPAEPLDDADRRQVARQIESAIGNDIFTQFVGGLQSRYGVSVNTTTLNSLIGTES